MLQPAVRDLTAMRWQPYTLTIAFTGYDFTGATFAMQIRASRDRTDPPLIDVSSGITSSLATSNGVPTSTVVVQISEAAIEGLNKSTPVGGDLSLFYDLVITGGGLPKTRWLEGRFIIHAGVTHG